MSMSNRAHTCCHVVAPRKQREIMWTSSSERCGKLERRAGSLKQSEAADAQIAGISSVSGSGWSTMKKPV